MRTKWKLAVPISVLALVFALGALAVANSGTSETPGKPGPTRLGQDPRQRFVDAAVNHPGGFGGWYIEDGVIYVYMTDPSADPEAAFRDIYIGEPPDMPVVAVRGNHSYDELMDWRNQVNEANRGYVTLSYSSIRLNLNRIVYGVLTVEEIEPAIAWIESLGVPRTAFEVKLDLFRPQ
jgi:hypothetical protein